MARACSSECWSAWLACLYKSLTNNGYFNIRCMGTLHVCIYVCMYVCMTHPCNLIESTAVQTSHGVHLSQHWLHSQSCIV